MKIFPDYLNGVGTPLGQAFMVLAGFMAILGLGFFLRQEYVLHSWSKAEGIVTASSVKEERSDNGDLLCSAVSNFTFSVKDQKFSSEFGGHTYTSDCRKVHEEVQRLINSPMKVLYDPSNPRSSYVNADNFDFFLVPFILAIMSFVFGFAGLVTFKIGNWLDKNKVVLP
jgi:hypothetical protein